MAEERARIQEEYRRRDADAAIRLRYHPDAPEERGARERLRMELRDAFAAAGLLPLSGRTILEVGCGRGAILEDLAILGARPDRMRGVDISAERLSHVPEPLRSSVILADASALPFADRSFDIVGQFTTFSSMLDGAMRAAAAREMARVVRPGGAIVWYDMRRTSRRSRTVALGGEDVRALFPGFSLDVRTVTLAPPLARRIGPRLAALSRALEAIPPLRTHLLVVLREAR